MSFDRDRSSGYMANWAARLFAKAIDQRLKPLGLSSGYMPVFFALAKGAALSQRALTHAASIEQPTMAATLARMHRDGLIEKRPDPQDGRSVLYSLSATGMEMTRHVHDAGRTINEQALGGLSSGEREALLAALSKVVANLEKCLED